MASKQIRLETNNTLSNHLIVLKEMDNVVKANNNTEDVSVMMEVNHLPKKEQEEAELTLKRFYLKHSLNNEKTLINTPTFQPAWCPNEKF